MHMKNNISQIAVFHYSPNLLEEVALIDYLRFSIAVLAHCVSND